MTTPAGPDLPARSIPFPAAAAWTDRLLAGRRTSWVVGLLSSLAALFVWGSLHPIPWVHDEPAYLLQAKLFAAGHWVGPPAPIPIFFEQMYVFVWPFTASKYFPGFSLSLVPGIWLGAPVLIPILMVGLTGALLFALASSFTNRFVGALTWLIWISTPHPNWSQPPFMSQHLTTLLWLASWWFLVRWRNGRAPRDLCLIAFFIGWAAITRPLTTVAEAIPILFVVIRDVARRNSWRELAVPAAIGTAVLAIVPLWSYETLGTIRTTPLAVHVRWYTPYDGLGFGRVPPRPLRPLPPDLEGARQVLGRESRRHTLDRLPAIVWERLRSITMDFLPGWRLIFVPLIFVGLFSRRAGVAFVSLTAAINFALYLLFPHPVKLTAYYFESYPVLAFLAALGLAIILRSDAKSMRILRFNDAASMSIRFILLIILLPPCLGDLYRYHDKQDFMREAKRHFLQGVAAIQEPAIVFVRYKRHAAAMISLVENDADLARERIWTVHDLGPYNAELIRLAPDRAPYLYDVGRDRWTALPRH